MFVTLPLITLILLFLIFRKTHCWRSAILSSAVVWGVFLTVITEVLSIFRWLTFEWLLGMWALSSIGLWFLYRHSVKKQKQVRPQRYSIEHQSILGQPTLQFLLLGLISIVAIIGLIALVAPPNTMDSMYYHMPRVMHWMQNHSVAHYPTHFTAQLFLSPWAEFAILHLQILSGGDHYANLIQWFSMIGSVVGSSLIAKQLGASLYGQTFAAVYCATIPMGILEASGTQNDYVVAFWLVCLAYYVLLTVQDEIGETHFLNIGLSLGLAILTKPTAYLYAFPFLVWLFGSRAKYLRLQLWKPISQVAIAALSLNIFHYLRNFTLFHTPLGSPPAEITYNNHVFGFSFFLSNAIRNLALHFSTPIPSINRFLIKGLSLIHSAFGLDISDPRISSSEFQLNSLINHEDLAGNPLHLLLILASIVFFGLTWREKRLCSHPLLLKYLLSIVAGFFLFCLILAWTPFNTRLHLSLFVLSSGFLGAFFSIFLRPKLVSTIVSILILASLPFVFFNETRPMIANSKLITLRKVENIFNVDRTAQYFITRPKLKDPFMESASFIKSQECSNIGLSLRRDSFEYPLWMILQEDKKNNYQFLHIDVKNISAEEYRLSPYKDFDVCLIFDNDGGLTETSNQRGMYTQEWSLPPISVLLKK